MAEKSPSVHYANWKEDMLLKKQLHVLNRSEKNIIHRIRIDQKVLFKRFQDKLHRSKISESRMLGDKERERELRSKNLHGLNTDLGNSEEDYSFLKKLESTPCIGKNGSKTCKQRRVSKTKSSRKRLQTEQKVDFIIKEYFSDKNKSDNQRQQIPSQRRKSVSEGMPLDATQHIAGQINGNALGIPHIALTIRPSTTDGVPKKKILHEIDSHADRSFTASPVSKSTNYSIKDKPSKTKNTRPFTCSPRAHSNGNLKEKLSNSEDGGKSQKSSGFFEDEQKVSLVEERLNKMKRLNYEPQIHAFYESLNSLRSSTVSDSDYYTIRLQAAMKEIAAHKHSEVPGTPENEYDRHIGNLDVVSLTFKKLNMNFKKDKFASSDSFKPDFTPVIIDDDETSDDDFDDDE